MHHDPSDSDRKLETAVANTMLNASQIGLKQIAKNISATTQELTGSEILGKAAAAPVSAANKIVSFERAYEQARDKGSESPGYDAAKKVAAKTALDYGIKKVVPPTMAVALSVSQAVAPVTDYASKSLTDAARESYETEGPSDQADALFDAAAIASLPGLVPKATERVMKFAETSCQYAGATCQYAGEQISKHAVQGMGEQLAFEAKEAEQDVQAVIDIGQGLMSAANKGVNAIKNQVSGMHLTEEDHYLNEVEVGVPSLVSFETTKEVRVPSEVTKPKQEFTPMISPCTNQTESSELSVPSKPIPTKSSTEDSDKSNIAKPILVEAGKAVVKWVWDKYGPCYSSEEARDRWGWSPHAVELRRREGYSEEECQRFGQEVYEIDLRRTESVLSMGPSTLVEHAYRVSNSHEDDACLVSMLIDSYESVGASKDKIQAWRQKFADLAESNFVLDGVQNQGIEISNQLAAAIHRNDVSEVQKTGKAFQEYIQKYKSTLNLLDGRKTKDRVFIPIKGALGEVSRSGVSQEVVHVLNTVFRSAGQECTLPVPEYPKLSPDQSALVENKLGWSVWNSCYQYGIHKDFHKADSLFDEAHLLCGGNPEYLSRPAQEIVYRIFKDVKKPAEIACKKFEASEKFLKEVLGFIRKNHDILGDFRDFSKIQELVLLVSDASIKHRHSLTVEDKRVCRWLRSLEVAPKAYQAFCSEEQRIIEQAQEAKQTVEAPVFQQPGAPTVLPTEPGSEPCEAGALKREEIPEVAPAGTAQSASEGKSDSANTEVGPSFVKVQQSKSKEALDESKDDFREREIECRKRDAAYKKHLEEQAARERQSQFIGVVGAGAVAVGLAFYAMKSLSSVESLNLSTAATNAPALPLLRDASLGVFVSDHQNSYPRKKNDVEAIGDFRIAILGDW